ncbi:MAG: molybdenum cofactor guanylyltransferase [Thermomicrobiales bacterium]|nr:molybdenum cofactor guanylyltransferase [Thermomicrobiales bacterium]
MREPLSAAILTGGQSRRMGEDKALLRINGQAMVARAAARLASVSDDVFLVGDRPEYHDFGLRVVGDDHPGGGALGGIATAVRQAGYDRVLVVACDMPNLSPALLRAMAALVDDAQVLIPTTAADRSDQGGALTWETTHAIYRRSCLPVFERRLQAGQRKIVDAVRELRWRSLSEDWIREYDPRLESFGNVNTPEELAGLRVDVKGNAAP